VERGQVTMQLSVREFQMMEYLMRHLIKFYLASKSNRHSGSGEQNQKATLLQRWCGDWQRLQAGAKDWLETVYGMGYRLKPSAQAESVPDLCLVVVVAIWLVGSHCQWGVS